MPERPRLDHRSASTLGATLQRFAFVGFAGVAISLLVLGKADPQLMERTRSAIADSVAPILAGLARPADALANEIQEARRWVHLHEENAHLRQENERLRQWQAVALRLESENEALRRLLAFVPDPEARFVSARVVADAGGTFANSVLVFGGAAYGIAIGDAAVTGDGLAGRVVSVAPHSARILLITDLNSRIPVSITTSGTRAILAGDNSPHPRLIHMTSDSPVVPGERIVTSGDAGAFPAGLPVGVVASVDGGVIRVKPYVERSRLDMVRIVDFGLGGIVGNRGRSADGARADDRGADDEGADGTPARPTGG